MGFETFKNTSVEEQSISIIQILGILLLLVGIAMSGWVFYSAVTLFKNPNDIAVFDKILPLHEDLRMIKVNDESIELPDEVFYFFAYCASILTLTIAGCVGGAFLSGGVNLLRPNRGSRERNFVRHFEDPEIHEK